MRVLLSLIMQENTQSNIIRKLNSHARYARLKAALFEYNALFKSIHILNLIDDMRLRKAIRNARLVANCIIIDRIFSRKEVENRL